MSFKDLLDDAQLRHHDPQAEIETTQDLLDKAAENDRHLMSQQARLEALLAEMKGEA